MRRKDAGALLSRGNARSLQLECERVLHHELFLSVLMYGSETMFWREKERSVYRVVQIYNVIRSLLGKENR